LRTINSISETVDVYSCNKQTIKNVCLA